MKKMLLWLLGILGMLVLLVYIFVFSPIGNAIIKPIAQAQINKYSPLPLPLTLDKFSLGLTGAHIVLKNEDKFVIDLSGSYNLFTLGVDFDLLVDVAEDIFWEMEEDQYQIRAFEMRAKAVGRVFDELVASATSNIARSTSTLNAIFYDLMPTKITAKISSMAISELLVMLGQKPYIDGSLNIEADIVGTQDKNPNFNGQATLAIARGSFSKKLMQKNFDTKIPHINWSANLSAIFNMDTIKHNLVFNAYMDTNTSSRSKIISSGDTQLSPLLTKSNYSIDLKDISAFAPLVGVNIRGAFNTSGEVIGGASQMKISGKSDIADSSTTYTALLESFSPKKITFDSKDLKLEQVFFMLNLPKYATGLEYVSGEIWDLDKGISAQVTSNLKGVIIGDTIKREFDLAMPNTPFSYKSNAHLQKGVGEADFTLESSLANLVLNPIAIDLHSTTIATPYTITIPNLKALKFLTGIELLGKLEANGKVKIAQSIEADFHTKSLGGELDAKLNGDNFSAKLNDLDTLSLLKMMQYPKIFSAKANGELTYNLAKQSGYLHAVLSQGHFMKNDLSNLLQQYVKFDLTGLVFNDVDIKSQINKMQLTSTFSAKSGDFYMQGDNILTDLEKGTINAKLKTAIKQDSVDVSINGATSAPKVEIDFSELVRKKAGQAIQNEFYKHKNKAADALKGLFQ